MEGGDFEPEGWTAFDDNGNGIQGNAGCGCCILAVAFIALVIRLCS